jgi:hypothetical protein
MGTWDIARLAGDASMDGPGYGCTIHDLDLRDLGHALCKQPRTFVEGQSDGSCPTGTMLVSPLVARSRVDEICSQLGTSDIARLAGGGSMDGSRYGCKIRDLDLRDLGHAVCAIYEVQEVQGDTPCASGYDLLTPTEAKANTTTACATLNTWDIARLAGGGSMDGSGYGCKIRERDTRALGNALCVHR